MEKNNYPWANVIYGDNIHGLTIPPNWPRFSFYRSPITNIHPLMNITIPEAWNYITGTYATERTTVLRTLTDKKRARLHKAAAFDYVTFSGTFTERKDQGLITHSGYLCIDFDHLPDLLRIKDILLNDSRLETQLLFTSPSGDGLKWIVSIDTEKAPHAKYFQAIAAYLNATYSLQVDRSGKDISRACFLPHDPNAYIHPKYLHPYDRRYNPQRP